MRVILPFLLNFRRYSSFSEPVCKMANPLVAQWEFPPFNLVQTSHYEEAFQTSMISHLEELEAIANESSAPTFDNTIVKFDESGKIFNKVSKVFSNLCLSLLTDDLAEVQVKMAPILAGHASKVYTVPNLFNRIDVVYSSRLEMGYNTEELRLIERIHLDFVRNGAKFDRESQKKYAEISAKLAELQTMFSQNVMKDEQDFVVPLTADDLQGLPDFVIASAKQAAIDAKSSHEYCINLSRSIVTPFLTFSPRRDLREQIFNKWTQRGELTPDRDNKLIAKEILLLRDEQAHMHSTNCFSEYQLLDTMAKSSNNVMDLLLKVWEPAKISANRERAELEKVAAADGITEILPHDWRYYAEKVRNTKYNVDDNEIKPYFSLESIVAAVFYVTHQLFGLKFVPNSSIPVYHPDVQAYEVFEEVKDANGNVTDKLLAIFLHDNFARPYKQSGAWMSDYRAQSIYNGENIIPIVVNNNNFAKGNPTLLSFDDCRTLFHEFGHGLHGMLSSCHYETLGGTNVLRDFVELPSQLYEHWIMEKEILKKFAVHYETRQPISDELLDKIFAAKNFNLGFETIEYTSSALIDQTLHSLTGDVLQQLDISALEESELKRLDMPRGIILRHRPPHFLHLFSSSSYAAAYYVYLWAEVLDADAFEAFKESGNCFDPATAHRVRQFIYSAGNTIDPQEAFRRYRGRDPVIEPMLKKKGLFKV